jgi:Domain of unknown function (DUF4837)
MKKSILISISIVVVSLFLSSCQSEQPAYGPEDQIIVVTDSSEFAYLQTALDSAFEKIIYTPQPEKLFTLKRISLDDFDPFKNYKNIVIVAPLNSNSQTSKFIRSVTDSTLIKKTEADPNFIIYKKNLWAVGQLVTVLTAPDQESLEFKILREKDNLLYAFQKASDQRLRESLYTPRFENEKTEGKLLKEYGWIVYVQADFVLAINSSKYNFVWLRRAPNSDMERWIFVHWINNASPEYLNPDSIRAIRNRLTKIFYRTSDDSSYVVIAEDYYTTNEVNFDGRYALFTQGLWELNVKGMGGPFINYTFFDEKSHRVYMIDGSLYAPKYYKRNLLQQMDVTLQSFMTKDQLSKDRIADLLDAAGE